MIQGNLEACDLRVESGDGSVGAVKLSSSQQRSVVLAMALVGDSDLLLLVAPTGGLGMGGISFVRSDTARLCVVNLLNRCMAAVS